MSFHRIFFYKIEFDFFCSAQLLSKETLQRTGAFYDLLLLVSQFTPGIENIYYNNAQNASSKRENEFRIILVEESGTPIDRIDIDSYKNDKKN